MDWSSFLLGLVCGVTFLSFAAMIAITPSARQQRRLRKRNQEQLAGERAQRFNNIFRPPDD